MTAPATATLDVEALRTAPDPHAALADPRDGNIARRFAVQAWDDR
jgi:hypothetical protein